MVKRLYVLVAFLLIALTSNSLFAQDATATPTSPKNEIEFKTEDAKCLVSFTEHSTALGGPSADMSADVDLSGLTYMTGKLVEVVTNQGVPYAHVYVALTNQMYYDIWFLGSTIKYNPNCENSMGRALSAVTADSFPCLAGVSPYTVSAYKFSGSDALGNLTTAQFSGRKVLLLGVKEAHYEIKLTKVKNDQKETLTVEPVVYEVPFASVIPEDSCYKAK